MIHIPLMKPLIDTNNPGKTDLVSCYGFEETSGTTCYDSHGSNDGTISGATINQTGKVGKCYSYNGTSSNINLSTHTSSFEDLDKGSICFWFKGNTDDAECVFSIGTTTSSWFGVVLGINTTRSLTNELITLNTTTASPSANVNNNRVGYTTTDRNELFDNAWHHIAVISTGIDYAIYLDGSSKSLSVGNGSNDGDWFSSLPSATYTSIGDLNLSPSTFYYTNGDIDELLIYSRALSADEISWLYNSGNGRSYSDL